MKLPIADCRLPIAQLSVRRRFAGCGHDGGQVAGLLQERGQFALGNDSCLGQQLKPKSGFIGFFLYGSHLGYKLCFASRTATGSVICGHGCAAADDLLGDNASSIVTFRDGAREFDNPKSERFGALFELERVHGPKLQKQSAIANRQSPIL
jgi:hypothetical protein